MTARSCLVKDIADRESKVYAFPKKLQDKGLNVSTYLSLYEEIKTKTYC